MMKNRVQSGLEKPNPKDTGFLKMIPDEDLYSSAGHLKIVTPWICPLPFPAGIASNRSG